MFCSLVSVGVCDCFDAPNSDSALFVVECGTSFVCLVGVAVGSAKDCRERLIAKRTRDILPRNAHWLVFWSRVLV